MSQWDNDPRRSEYDIKKMREEARAQELRDMDKKEKAEIEASHQRLKDLAQRAMDAKEQRRNR